MFLYKNQNFLKNPSFFLFKSFDIQTGILVQIFEQKCKDFKTINTDSATFLMIL